MKARRQYSLKPQPICGARGGGGKTQPNSWQFSARPLHTAQQRGLPLLLCFPPHPPHHYSIPKRLPDDLRGSPPRPCCSGRGTEYEGNKIKLESMHFLPSQGPPGRVSAWPASHAHLLMTTLMSTEMKDDLTTRDDNTEDKL